MTKARGRRARSVRRRHWKRKLFGAADMAAVVRALAKGASVVEAARVAGFGKTALYDARRKSEPFRAAWADAIRDSARPVLIAATGGRKYQLRRPRRVLFDRDRQLAFLEHFGATCDAIASAAEAGVGITTVLNKRRTDPVFAEGWQEALAQGYARLEAEHVKHRLQAALRLDFRGDKIVPGAAEEFERALALLKEYKRVLAGRPKGGRPPSKCSVEEAFAELERRLKIFKARRAKEKGEKRAPRDRPPDDPRPRSGEDPDDS